MSKFIRTKTVIKFVRAQGLTVRYDVGYMEFVIDFKKSDSRWNEDTAYYTTYRDDAVLTAAYMANFKGNNFDGTTI